LGRFTATGGDLKTEVGSHSLARVPDSQHPNQTFPPHRSRGFGFLDRVQRSCRRPRARSCQSPRGTPLPSPVPSHPPPPSLPIQIVAFPFPPTLANDTMWSSFRERKKSLPEVIQSSSSAAAESRRPVLLSPQEKLYSDYLNLSHTFSPGDIHVTCHCCHHGTAPTTQPTTTTLTMSSPPAPSKDTQRLRQEILKDFYSSLKIPQTSPSLLSSPSPVLTTPSPSLAQEGGSSAAPVPSGEQEVSLENAKATPSPAPLASSSATLPPSSSSSSSQQTPFALKGIWPFRSKTPVTPKVCPSRTSLLFS
jgi:hypothetical protein